MSAVIAADPGSSGALALLDDGLLLVVDMPTVQVKSGNGMKRRIDLHALIRQIRSWGMVYNVSQAITENVSAMPGQSPNGMFQFGFACAAVQCAFVAADLPMRLITPQVWKKYYGLVGGKENKDASRLAASRLFPQHAHYWERKKDDGRAEAVLLANFGRMQ